MAGDLYIQNIEINHFRFLQEAGGTVGQDIFHANRNWYDCLPRLWERVDTGEKISSRAGLPAHAYVTFLGDTQFQIPHAFVRDNLGKVLAKVLHPLGLVSRNPNLNDWPNQLGSEEKKVGILIEAVRRANVVIEYYQYNGQPILAAFETSGWARHNEQPGH